MLAIPLTQVPSQRLQVVLDDQYCTIALRWMQCRLYLSLSVGSTEVCKGAVCVNRADIVQSKSLDFSGSLHFYDTEGDAAPEWSGLWNGTTGRWRLIYVSADEDLPEVLEH